MMVMYWLAWAVLRETVLSSVEWSGCVRKRSVVLGFVMMVMVVVTSMLLARTETLEIVCTY
jgi:hypothetical protein